MYFRSRDLVLLDDRGRRAKEDGWAGRDTDKLEPKISLGESRRHKGLSGGGGFCIMSLCRVLLTQGRKGSGWGTNIVHH